MLLCAFQLTNAQKSGVYQFDVETEVLLTSSDDNKSYKMSYLLSNDANYMAIKADMSEYSDQEMAGESLIVMDNGEAHIFVETQGMKIRMSPNMMNDQMENPVDQMANYDYSGLTKTGKSKIILGATCYEYVMTYKKDKISMWIAPEVKLPNWFAQNNELVDGHIMEYTLETKDGKMTSTTTAINENISRTVNPKDYRKMF